MFAMRSTVDQRTQVRTKFISPAQLAYFHRLGVFATHSIRFYLGFWKYREAARKYSTMLS
jgi:hypothetical protein